MQSILSLGLMSGTSLDGIDAALIRTDGIRIQELKAGITLPYEEEFRLRMKERLNNPEKDLMLEEELTRRHAEVVLSFLKDHHEPIDILGFHGQTIFHAPPHTYQWGDGQLLANLAQLPVVYDFRTQDCQQGGQGAPLVPVFHQALCLQSADTLMFPVVVVNIGGVANLTYIEDADPETPPIAFDTGPGNALIDDFMMRELEQAYDLGGKIASFGKPHLDLLHEWLQDPYFQQAYPKSLDRNHFQRCLVEARGKHGGIDGLATLTAFTAFSIFHGIQQLPQMPNQVIVCGGGRKNQTILHWLRFLLRGKQIIISDDLGWNGDLMEAYAFGFLAVRSLYKLPLSFPTTTGVQKPCLGGIYVRPQPQERQVG